VESLSGERALDVIESWLAQPCVTVVHPGDRHTAEVRRLPGPLGTAANLVGDAHLAALAIEHGAELCSCDTDFARFVGLRRASLGRSAATTWRPRRGVTDFPSAGKSLDRISHLG